jgi:toxin FitB
VRAFVAAQPAHLLHSARSPSPRSATASSGSRTRRQDIALWLERTLQPLFAGRTLEVSEDVILRWRQMLEVGRQRGRTFGQPDLFVAAIAALKDLIVVSRDTREFVAAGVPVLDPWTSTYTPADGSAVTLRERAQADLLATIGTEP